MPYIEQESVKAIDGQGLEAVKTVGDLNYFITRIVLNLWLTNPKYNTIHAMRKELVTDPKSSKFIQNLRTELADRFDVADIHTAAALAFDEFYARVGRLYEALKCRANGDVQGYPEAISPLLKELGTEIKKEQTSQIIIPGAK